MIGLRNGLPGARLWRQVWSDHGLKDAAPAAVMTKAHAAAANAAPGSQAAPRPVEAGQVASTMPQRAITKAAA